MDSKVESEILARFLEISQTLVNTELQQWKATGGKVIGCFCSYVPEEIITAAGIVPFRMRATGSTGTDEAGAYLSQTNCSFCRHCLSMGIRGDFEFLDGAVWVNSCDHVRRIYDNWIRKVKTPFTYMISLPRKTGKHQAEWLRDEFADFKNALEKQFGVSISDDDLWKAIGIHNKTRRLQREVYELRKRDDPPITGAQTLATMVAGTAMPREQYNQLLKQLLDELNQSEGHRDYRARLMIIGGILDDPAYIAAIESQGALVVTDSLCFGSRTCWKDIDESLEDPLYAIARYHAIDRPACPRMHGEQANRADFNADMIREFKVDGVIGERIIFCDYWSGEHFIINNRLREGGIPFIKLDREYVLSGVGQLRTRIQAFLETIEGGKS